MTVKETINLLEHSSNYVKDRLTVSDEFIEMLKVMLPNDWDRIKEKEEHYQNLINILNKN